VPADLSNFRPQLPSLEGVRPATNGGSVIVTPRGEQADLTALTMRPGNPDYYSKMPPPYDDGTRRELGGRKLEEVLAEMEQETTPTDAPVSGATPLAQSVAVGKRVAIYWGPNEKFVVAVETAPEWDMAKSWRLDPQTVLLLLPVLEALGIRVKDVTGGGIDDFRTSLQEAPAPARKSAGRRKSPARASED
jgi:hypothetical protein